MKIVASWVEQLSYSLPEKLKDVVWLDIETRKVAAPESFSIKRRWQTFMAGVAWVAPGACAHEWFLRFQVVASEDEAELIGWLRFTLSGKEVRYDATHKFDEMVLRGRYVTCFRRPQDEPGEWPNLDTANVEWNNVHKVLRPVEWDRAPDVLSKEVPDAWAAGREQVVATHCLRDVMENVLRDPDGEWSLNTRSSIISKVIRK